MKRRPELMLWMRLSILFGKPVWELQREWTSRGFALYAAYNQVEPITQDREDMRAALLTSVVANALRDPKSAASKPRDFLARSWVIAERLTEQIDPRLVRKARARARGLEPVNAMKAALLKSTQLSGGKVLTS